MSPLIIYNISRKRVYFIMHNKEYETHPLREPYPQICDWFMPTECLEGYVHMLEILVTKYGILENFYSDKNTILICPKDDNLTDFGYMCEDLRINIIAVNKYILMRIDNQKQLEQVLREKN